MQPTASGLIYFFMSNDGWSVNHGREHTRDRFVFWWYTNDGICIRKSKGTHGAPLTHLCPKVSARSSRAALLCSLKPPMGPPNHFVSHSSATCKNEGEVCAVPLTLVFQQWWQDGKLPREMVIRGLALMFGAEVRVNKAVVMENVYKTFIPPGSLAI